MPRHFAERALGEGLAPVDGLEEEDALLEVGREQGQGYLLNYRHMLLYDHYVADGLPIATGVIEGACRHLIQDRMDITGARWSVQGAEAVLRFRSLRSSGDFEEYWSFHQRQELERNYLFEYSDRSRRAG